MHWLINYIALISTTVLLNSMPGYCDCFFELNEKMDDLFQPIYFVQTGESYELAWPRLIRNKHIIQLEPQQILVITCPNIHCDVIPLPLRYHTEEIQLTCTDSQLVPLDGEIWKLDNTTPTDYQCVNRTGFTNKKVESRKATVKQCPNKNSILYEVGIYVNFISKSKLYKEVSKYVLTEEMRVKLNCDWFPLYTICIGVIDYSFTVHTIDGQLLPHRQTKRIYYKEELTRSIGMDFVWCTTEALNRTFSRILNTKYIDVEKKKLTFMPLLPESDMIFLAWKHAVHTPHIMYIMWNQVTGAWKSIENVIRMAAIKLRTKLTIYSGIYKRLELTDKKSHIIRASSTGVSIPQYYWKIVYRADTNEGIVFILHNNPYYDGKDETTICANICQDYGWKVENRVQSMGEVYCCDVNDMIKRNEDFRKLETLFNVENVLKMPTPSP